jgi:hypothetical protein
MKTSLFKMHENRLATVGSGAAAVLAGIALFKSLLRDTERSCLKADREVGAQRF